MTGVLLAADAIAAIAALIAFSSAWSLRARLSRLRAQLAEERIEAMHEQQRMIAAAVATGGHDLALRMLDAAARREDAVA